LFSFLTVIFAKAGRLRGVRIDAVVTPVTSLERAGIAEEEDMTVEVDPSGEDIGGEVAGIDISKPLSALEIAAVKAAFVDRTVLVFRGQKLTDRQFADFSAQFGPLRVHIQKAFQHPDIPEIVYNRNVDADGKFDEVGASRGVTRELKYGWHSDTSYEIVPAVATTVHALEVPSSGGNTCFASGYRAYESLPDAFKGRLEGLMGEYALGRNSKNSLTQTLTGKLPPEARSRATVFHPIICRHPVSRRPAIYANPLQTVRVMDVSEAESEDILETLFEAIHVAGTTGGHWEHEWQVGDTIMWENRGGVFHSGRMDYPLDERRIMIRCTVGSCPIEAYSAAA
jgi:taurine dioxygenase